jgi:hypothetical protein
MKKVFPILIVSSLLASPLHALPIVEEAGWEFTLSLNTGYVSSQSNLSVSDDNKVISDIYSEAESSNSFIAFPLARLQYTTQDLKTQFFFGNSRDQISISQFQFEFGITHQFENKGKLTVAYFPQLPLFNETWQDPYLVGQDRIKTDENTQGGRFELSRIAGSPLTVKYAFALSSVENDKSGESWFENGAGLTAQELQSLQRDSQYHRVAIETMFPIYSKVFLKPVLQYTVRISDGDSESYEDYDFQLGFLIFNGRHTSITTINIGSSAYKQENPIYNMKQDSLNAGIFSIYNYAEAFNWKPVTFTLIVGYSQKDSDITFYDESGLIVSTGLAVTF